ncbi:MAG: hypothetical protein A3J10_03700 [Candidatus Sungbacteria bacterium RIFCSPLOWO2_02_FULL_54_10]|nr:MAG: hypothetical protein A3J10_03700 [Candidatus Sungbacteria bacterium RIFCSPLOWO2_02_FULL_54_10]
MGVRSFAVVPHMAIWILGLAAVIGFVIGVRRRQEKVWFLGLCAAALLAGVFRFDMVERVRPKVAAWQGRNVQAEGVVWAEPRRGETTHRVKIKTNMIDGVLLDEPFFILTTVRPYPAYRIGDRVRVRGVIEKPENFSDFDYISYLARDGIFAVMAFPQAEKTGEDTAWRLTVVLARVKDALESKIENALPEPHAAFMKGLLLGERASLPENVIENFKIAGVSHIVALSGYNITIVGRSLMNILLMLTVPFFMSFWIAIGAIFLFVLMTGAAASVVRAAIMGVLVLVAKKEGRSYHMTNAMAFAAAVMVFQNPYILRFDAGFQLSFLATAGLVYLSPHVERRVHRVLPAKEEGAPMVPVLRKVFIETMSAQLMVLPLLIWLFGSVSLISPVANIAVLVAVPYAMGAGFVAAMLGFASSLLGTVAGWGAWAILEYQLRAIALFARIPFASVEIGAWIAIPLCALYGIMLYKIWKSSQNTRA